jgi:hypothetical protein
MILSTSAVAVCYSRASISSRLSRTTSVSWPEAEELPWRTAFSAFALRLRALASLLLALERRRIAFLKAWDHANWMDDYSRDLRLTKWGSEVSVHGSNPQLRMSALGQKRTFRSARLMSALPPKADIGIGPY